MTPNADATWNSTNIPWVTWDSKVLPNISSARVYGDIAAGDTIFFDYYIPIQPNSFFVNIEGNIFPNALRLSSDSIHASLHDLDMIGSVDTCNLVANCNGELYEFSNFTNNYIQLPNVTPNYRVTFYYHVTGWIYNNKGYDFPAPTVDITTSAIVYALRLNISVMPETYWSLQMMISCTKDIISSLGVASDAPSYTDTSISDASDKLASSSKDVDDIATNIITTASNTVDSYDFSWLPASVTQVMAGFAFFQPIFSALISPPIIASIISLVFIFLLFISFVRRL